MASKVKDELRNILKDRMETVGDRFPAALARLVYLPENKGVDWFKSGIYRFTRLQADGAEDSSAQDWNTVIHIAGPQASLLAFVLTAVCVCVWE